MRALRILILEDDVMTGGLLAETLEDLGHTVCAVETNAANAVATAACYRPDVMIIDVGLGEARGVAAVKEILGCGFVPHVFVTGDTLRDLSVGPNALLIQKPFRGPDIVKAIQRAANCRAVSRRRRAGGPAMTLLLIAQNIHPPLNWSKRQATAQPSGCLT